MILFALYNKDIHLRWHWGGAAHKMVITNNESYSKSSRNVLNEIYSRTYGLTENEGDTEATRENEQSKLRNGLCVSTADDLRSGGFDSSR